MEDYKNYTKNARIARNTLLMTIRFCIVLCINLYVTRAVLAAMGVDDFGIYNVVCGFVSMFAFLNTSMTNGIQRFYNYEIGQGYTDGVRAVYQCALVIQAILVVLILIGSETFGLWFIRNKLVASPDRLMAAQWVFQLSVVSFAAVIMQVPYSSIIIAKEKMDFYALVSVVDALLKLGVALLLPFVPHDKLIWYGFMLPIISIINFLFYFIYAKVRFEEIRIVKSAKTDPFWKIISFSGWNIFGSFSYMLREQGIDVMMNLFFGPVVNAARGIANQVNSAFTSFVGNLTIAIRPQVIQSYSEGDIHRTISLTYTISKLSCSVLYSLSLPILMEIGFILNIWLAGHVPDHTEMFLVIVILISYINNLNSAVSGVIHASGRMMVYQLVTSLISISSLPISYAILRHGSVPETALLVVLICVSISQVASLFILKHIVPEVSLRHYFMKIILPLLCMVVVTLPFVYGIHLAMNEGWLRLIVVTGVAIFAILPALYYIVLDKNEKELVRMFTQKIFAKR